MNRRDLLQLGVTGVAMLPSLELLDAVSQGGVAASDRIRIGVIGTGNRGNEVTQSWLKYPDSTVVAICDVAKDRLENTAGRLAAAGHKVDTCEDYRRILDRQDIDAVLIAAPDHWHSAMTIDAIAAGKDVYCEKPVSNAIEPAVKMLEAARRSNRIVQIGLQQRSWAHYMDAARLFVEGVVGTPNHVVMAPPGIGVFGGTQQQPLVPQPPPPTLNWEMYQGPASRTPFMPQRLAWRNWYAYGGGNITDWGVHLADVMNWYLKLDETVPALVHTSAQYVLTPHNPERVPDTYVATMQYGAVVATLSNTGVFGPDNEPLWGNYFFGDRALMLVNRSGYEVRPRPVGGGRGRGAGSGVPPAAPQPASSKVRFGFDTPGERDQPGATAAHIRDFLDCVRSRQRPRADVSIGFHSTLPTLMALESIKAGGRAIKWDSKAKRASVV